MAVRRGNQLGLKHSDEEEPPWAAQRARRPQRERVSSRPRKRIMRKLTHRSFAGKVGRGREASDTITDRFRRGTFGGMRAKRETAATRRRKSGPYHAVAVVGCRAHGGRRYTRYPRGHLPVRTGGGDAVQCERRAVGADGGRSQWQATPHPRTAPGDGRSADWGQSGVGRARSRSRRGWPTAILGRLLHHSHVLTITGESYRLHQKWRAGERGIVSVRGCRGARPDCPSMFADGVPPVRAPIGRQVSPVPRPGTGGVVS